MHIIIDTATPASDWPSDRAQLLERIQVAATAVGVTRISRLDRRAGAFLGNDGATSNSAIAEATSNVTTLLAPARVLQSPVREAQRLRALCLDLGADLLVTWDLPPSAIASAGERSRALLFLEETQTTSTPEETQTLAAAGILVAKNTASDADLRDLLQRALAHQPTGASPQQQAAIQGARLKLFAAQAVLRAAEPGTMTSPSATALDDPRIDARNALVFVLGPRHLYRRHIVSRREIICGPDMETTFVDGRLATLNVPAGAHDAQTLINWLPANQKPDLIVVKADATGRNLPGRLAGVKCAKVLLVGDTHHMDAPVRRVLEYAHSEPFDFVVMDHTRHHGHYFVESGFSRVSWLPAFDISAHATTRRENQETDPSVVFVGQVGPLHPFRSHVLQTLTDAKVPLHVLRAPPDKAAQLYADARVSLNASLNGDLNLRVFEIMAAGGCLLTDKLSQQAGLDDLFQDRAHLVYYDSDESLVANARDLLAHPERAQAIASSAHARFQEEHCAEARVASLTKWIDSGVLESRWDLSGDKRSRHIRSTHVADLNARLVTYEAIQELHRAHTAGGKPLGIVAWPDVDPRLLADLVDLPRLHLSIFGESSHIDPIARRTLLDAGVWESLTFVGEADLASDVRSGGFDSFLLSTDAWMASEPKVLAQLARARTLMIAVRTETDGRNVLSRQGEFASEGYLAEPGAIPTFRQRNPVALGELAASEGRLEEALSQFQAALAADPEYVDALNNLGVLAQQTGDEDTAASFLELAIQLDRYNVTALTNLAGLRQGADRLKDAETLLFAATRATPNDGDLWQQLAQIRHERGDNHGARDALLQLGAIEPNRPGIADAMETLRAGVGGDRSGVQPAAVPLPPRDAGVPKAARLRILLLNNLYPPQELGGYGRLMWDFASYLEELGHTVHVLTSDTTYLGTIREPEASITRSLQLFGSWKNGRVEELDRDGALACVRANHATLKTVIESFQPDVAFVGNTDFVSPGIFAPLLDRGIPVLHYLANGQPGYTASDTPTSPLYRPVTCSQWLAEKIKSTHPLRDVRAIYPGARVSEFAMPMAPLRRRLHIAYASLVMPYKGPHVLMGALEELARRRIDFTCTIAGDSTDSAFLQHLHQRAQVGALRSRVRLPGYLDRPKLRALFARCNVLVFPSVFEEPFGISQIEAMAAGLTVVTSGTGGAAEVVEHEKSGLVFPTEDSGALADLLAGLPGDPARWDRLGEEGTRRAHADFDMRKLADVLEGELLALAEKSSRPPRMQRKALPVVAGGRQRA